MGFVPDESFEDPNFDPKKKRAQMYTGVMPSDSELMPAGPEKQGKMKPINEETARVFVEAAEKHDVFDAARLIEEKYKLVYIPGKQAYGRFVKVLEDGQVTSATDKSATTTRIVMLAEVKRSTTASSLAAVKGDPILQRTTPHTPQPDNEKEVSTLVIEGVGPYKPIGRMLDKLRRKHYREYDPQDPARSTPCADDGTPYKETSEIRLEYYTHCKPFIGSKDKLNKRGMETASKPKTILRYKNADKLFHGDDVFDPPVKPGSMARVFTRYSEENFPGVGEVTPDKLPYARIPMTGCDLNGNPIDPSVFWRDVKPGALVVVTFDINPFPERTKTGTYYRVKMRPVGNPIIVLNGTKSWVGGSEDNAPNLVAEIAKEKPKIAYGTNFIGGDIHLLDDDDDDDAGGQKAIQANVIGASATEPTDDDCLLALEGTDAPAASLSVMDANGKEEENEEVYELPETPPPAPIHEEPTTMEDMPVLSATPKKPSLKRTSAHAGDPERKRRKKERREKKSALSAATVEDEDDE